MENATDALLMGFAVLIFVIALTVSFSTLAQAKSTADVVLFYTDRENFQTPLKDDPTNVSNGGRTVELDTVIATIFRCGKEGFIVKIDEDNDGKYEYIFEYDISNDKEIKAQIDKFINEHQGTTYRYREEYVEVTERGDIYSAEDESVVLEENAGKKLHIIYKKIS